MYMNNKRITKQNHNNNNNTAIPKKESKNNYVSFVIHYDSSVKNYIR